MVVVLRVVDQLGFLADRPLAANVSCIGVACAMLSGAQVSRDVQ